MRERDKAIATPHARADARAYGAIQNGLLFGFLAIHHHCRFVRGDAALWENRRFCD